MVRLVRAPPAFADLAATALCHRDPERFGLLYRLLFRLQREKGLLEIATDPDVARAGALARAVRRDAHKMTAFVRFREEGPEGQRLFSAWFEPEHYVEERVAPHFTGRYAAERFVIATPRRTWCGTARR